MKAKITGIKKTNFAGKDGQVKRVAFHMLLEKGNVDEGQAVDKLSFDEMINGNAPEHKVGDTVNVEYNDKGRLIFS